MPYTHCLVTFCYVWEEKLYLSYSAGIVHSTRGMPEGKAFSSISINSSDVIVLHSEIWRGRQRVWIGRQFRHTLPLYNVQKVT